MARLPFLTSIWWLRVLLFAFASNLAVLFVLIFGQKLWPDGLPAHSQNVFWLASGINVAGLLLLGLNYWPVILLDAFPAHWLAGEPLDLTTLGSGTNALEALLAAWMIRRFGVFDGGIDRLRPTGILLIASLVTPLVNTLIIPAYFCLRGMMRWESYGEALGNWNLANGTAMLMVTPMLLALFHGEWANRKRWREVAGLLVVGAAASGVVFLAYFSGANENLVFLVFPVVIYASIRFGLQEVSAVFFLILLVIYLSLAWHPHKLFPDNMASSIWFTQAFCWVLAATGLLVTALMTERSQAERRTLEEQGRVLEASLREERARLDALRYQINPHFLFNALNSIRAEMPLTLTTPREMLTDLAKYLRSTLDDAETDTVPLREEIGSVGNYLAIEKKRFGEMLRLSIQVDPAVEEIRVPVFLLQPLVENAIRHGLEGSKDPCDLRIRASLDSARLKIEVVNSGTWKELGERKGLGLENIRCRLELLYGPVASFVRVPEEGHVCFRIELPLKLPRESHALPDR